MKALLLLIPFLITVFIVSVNHGINYFIDPMALIYLILFSFSLFSYSEGRAGFSILYQVVFKKKRELEIEKTVIYKAFNSLILYNYIAGVMALMVGQIMLLNIYPLSEFSTQRHIADTFLTLLYSTILNEIVIRPIRNSIQL